MIQSRKITDVSPRVLDKESVRVLQRFREKPFVVPKALKAEGKKDKPEKNLNLNCLLILSLFSCSFSVKLIKPMSTFHFRAQKCQINFLFNYVMHNYKSLSHQKYIYNIYWIEFWSTQNIINQKTYINFNKLSSFKTCISFFLSVQRKSSYIEKRDIFDRVTHCNARMKCVGELKTINLRIRFELMRVRARSLLPAF